MYTKPPPQQPIAHHDPPVGIKKHTLHGRRVPHALQTWDCFHGQRHLGSEVAEVRTFFWMPEDGWCFLNFRFTKGENFGEP